MLPTRIVDSTMKLTVPKKFALVLLGVALAVCGWSLAVDTSPRHVAVEASDLAFDRVYVNAVDIRRIAKFYVDVFGASYVEPRDGQTPLINGKGTPELSVRTAEYAGQGPIITFMEHRAPAQVPLGPQDLGYAHICFETDDVAGLVARIVKHGGQLLSQFDDPYKSPVIYAKDPDGNVVEVHIPLPSPLTPGTILRAARSAARSYLKLGTHNDADTSRFLHVNINAPQWEKTVAFYEAALHVEKVGLKREYEGEFIGRLTGVNGAKVFGQHVALPGYTPGGPTFEVFTYEAKGTSVRLASEGLGRIAVGFSVRDLPAAEKRFADAGGTVVAREPGSSLLRDVDGNLVLMVRK